MGNIDRSGKMRVLAEILKLWHREQHKVIIFSQTVQMLDFLQTWLHDAGYVNSRIDGKVPVKRRLELIDQFNVNPAIFAMVLTTHVGGVGLNIIGASRVVIFDPDWNPMTDVQARERAWRIGQKKDVTVYRLVCSGTLEEKIYHRQVYKHFLSQKVLSDPRQRRFFKWNDLTELFVAPPRPPTFDPAEVHDMPDRYRNLFQNKEDSDEDEVETKDVMAQISNLPLPEANTLPQSSANEHLALLETLYDKAGIKTTFSHDKVEQPLLDRKLVRSRAHEIAQSAVKKLKDSQRERNSHEISTPTWTGKSGIAGATRHMALANDDSLSHHAAPVKEEKGSGAAVGEVKVKREKKEEKLTKDEKNGGGEGLGRSSNAMLAGEGRPVSAPKSSEILSGLRALARMRGGSSSSGSGGQPLSQSEESAKRGMTVVGGRPAAVKRLTGQQPSGRQGTIMRKAAAANAGAGPLAITSGPSPTKTETPSPSLPAKKEENGIEYAQERELQEADQKIAEKVLAFFLNQPGNFATTGRVLEALTSNIAQHHKDLFKSVLCELCEMRKGARESDPSIWVLRAAFRTK